MVNNILVLGGGVAGLSLAIALKKKGYSTTIVEKSNYDNFVHGEHVPSSVVNLLDLLSVPNSILMCNSIRCNGVVGYWAEKEIINQGIFNQSGFDFILNRPNFEFDIYQYAMSLGVNFHLCTKLYRINKNKAILKNGLIISFDHIFDCTGRLSTYHNNTRLIFDSLIGITYTIPHKKEKRDNSEVLIDSTENGWWYSVSNSYNSIVTFFTDKDIYKKLNLDSELETTNLLRKKIEKIPQKANIMPCYTSILRNKPDTIFQVGDSFASYDPLSSLGIYKAFSNANIIAENFGDNKNLDKVYDKFRTDFLNYIDTRTKFYRQGYEHYQSEFYKRRIVER